MIQQRQLLIHFNSGPSMAIGFPRQCDDAFFTKSLQNILSGDKIVLETQGTAHIFSWSSIRYIEVAPVTAANLPATAICGVQIMPVAAMAGPKH